MTLPRFVLGHNALIGVNHRDHTLTQVKTTLTKNDELVLLEAAELGVRAMVLDNHPVALQAADLLRSRAPQVQVIPMVPYAQQVVDSVSRAGLGGMISDMAKTSLTMGPLNMARAVAAATTGNLPTAGSITALAHHLSGFGRVNAPACFLHNAVTDLFAGWEAHDALAGFARACRGRNMAPGFVTLNPGSIPEIRRVVGDDAWFMCAVNSRGIQMSPNQSAAEEVLRNPSLNVIAMSVLGGGLLDPEKEIPRTYQFPAVKSIVASTSRVDNLRKLVAIVEQEGGLA